MKMTSLALQTSQWWNRWDLRPAKSRSSSANLSNMSRNLLNGGSLIATSTQTCIRWRWITSAFLVINFIKFISSYITNKLLVATSTAVQHVFLQGCQLLSFSCNSLRSSSIRAFLCLGSWGRCDLVFFEDIVAAVNPNLKRKQESSDVEEVE